MHIDKDNYIKLLKNKNEAAMEYVIRTYGGMMKTVISKILYSYLQDAEECLSDCFLRIWNHIDSFDKTKSTFKNWSCSIAKYAALDRLRKLKHLLATEDINSLVIEDDTPITGDKLFDEFFCELISCLNEEDKIIFIRIFWQGDTIEETANATGKTKEVIYNRISRGRKKIIKFNPGYFEKET